MFILQLEEKSEIQFKHAEILTLFCILGAIQFLNFKIIPNQNQKMKKLTILLRLYLLKGDFMN